MLLGSNYSSKKIYVNIMILLRSDRQATDSLCASIPDCKAFLAEHQCFDHGSGTVSPHFRRD
jgi:hypothetical protein